jgi:hypothetical protein
MLSCCWWQKADANPRKILGQAARIGALSELDFETTTSFETPISNDTRHRARARY